MAIARLAVIALAFAAALGAATTLPDGFVEDTLVGGLSSPTCMGFAPDGRLFICEQGGALRVWTGTTLTTALTLPVDANGERGLLGVEFDPAFAANRFIYLYHTVPGSPAHNRLSRFTMAGNSVVAGSEVDLLDLDPLSGATNHNGGALHVGGDGKLYIAVGENANGANAQTLGNLLGKLLRLNLDGTIPADNPFLAQTSGRNQAIFAYGLRNPFTFAFRDDGLLFINDVGQDTWEEIDVGRAGANYGWPTTEGATSDPRFVGPLYTYRHGSTDTTGCAITGGVFYPRSGGTFPAAYAGRYFFSDYCGSWIRVVDPASGAPSAFALGVVPGVVDLDVRGGDLHYLTRGDGSVRRIRYVPGSAPSIAQQPQDATVSVGGSATFTVSASGTAPLSYQWRRGGVAIGGATGASYTLTNAQAADDGAVFSVVVSNAAGSATSANATLHVVANRPPTPTIATPPAGSTFAAGDTIAFSGGGTDPEDGTLPASALTWWIDLHHDTHTHPALPPTSGVASGAFAIPTVGETSANIWYRIHLRATDSGGLSAETTRDVLPRTVTVTLATDPAGLALTLDGQPAPASFVGVVGIQRTLSAPSPQAQGATTWVFDHWSDGGPATHAIATPSANTTYTASFRALGTYVESAGLVVVEAEKPHAATIGANGHAWNRVDDAAASSGAAMQAMPDSGVNQDTDYAAQSPRLTYRVSFADAGTWFVWARGHAVAGQEGSSDSLHVGIDGAAVATADRISSFDASWGWSSATMDGPRATIVVPSAGVHTVDVWMREDGFTLDKLALTRDAAWTPSGVGPAESPMRGPFGGVARAIPGRIQAEDFDEGGEGVAYHDNDASNNGGAYRATGVDVRASYDTGGGFQVGWFGGGEWLEYTVSAASDATYDVGVRVASGAGGATIHLSIDGADRTGPLAFGDTGGWDTFTTVVRSGVAIGAGTHVVRLTCDGGALDANWLSFEPSGIVPGLWYKLVAEHSGKCLDVSGASTLDGANVQQWSDNGTTAQQWRIDLNGDGSYTLVARCSGKALDVAGASLVDGGNIIQWTPHGGANQRWWIADTGGGWYRLTSVNSGKVVDVEGVSTADGANVHQWGDWGGANQRWAIIAVAPAALAIADPDERRDR